MKTRDILTSVIEIITFTNLPIRKKFLLFSAGTLLWLIITSLIGFLSVYFVNKESAEILHGIAPQQDAISSVIRKLRGANISAHKMIITTDRDDIETLYNTLRTRLKDSANIMVTLLVGGLIRDELRSADQTVDEYSILPISDEESRAQIKSLIEKINELLLKADKIYAAKISSIDQKEPKILLEGYDSTTKTLVNELTILMTLNKKNWHRKSKNIENLFHRAMIFIALALFCGTSLSIVFGFLIAKNLVRPIDSILRRFRSFYEKGFSSEGNITLRDRDEIAYLSIEFKKLLDSIENISSFKRLIEEDESIEDIYVRIGTTFSERLHMERLTIYEISTITNSIKQTYSSVGETGSYCSTEILNDCNICKVKRSGRVISSVENERICKYFKGIEGDIHVCFPVMITGKVGLVIFWVTDKQFLSSTSVYTITKTALDYINAAQPVIQGKRFLRALRETSIKDQLTGLYNRRFLEESSAGIIAGIRRRGSTLGLLMCDLDFFKETNDKYGHDIGDMVLQETANYIKTSVREADYVIRFGGEEFLVLLIDIKEGQAGEIAEKIRKNIDTAEFNINGTIIKKTISIGVSEFPKDTVNLWEAIKFADVALYKAKEAGRNIVIRFTTDMWGESRY